MTCPRSPCCGKGTAGGRVLAPNPGLSASGARCPPRWAGVLCAQLAATVALPAPCSGRARAHCGLVSMATADESASGGGRDGGGQELEGGVGLGDGPLSRQPFGRGSQFHSVPSVGVTGSRVGFGSARGRPAHSMCASWTCTVCWAMGTQPRLSSSLRLYTLRGR